ncbi:MAG: deoxyribose-phosphate aldolase [Bacillota bacterium]|nr:deoxyribose-phosphate aldolase [Bacillota bacterium]
MTREQANQLAQLVDHTLLKPEATEQQIRILCQQALQYNFASVCVNPSHVKMAASSLQGSQVATCTVVGFPLGANTTAVKVAETIEAVNNGAKEIDMVVHMGAIKEGNWNYVKSEIKSVVEAAGMVVKVILETCHLTNEEKITTCHVAMEAGAHFVKTSTGFGSGGATVEDVQLLRQTVGQQMGVKASGGIKDLETLLQMVQAGANRIGTSSAVQIIKLI